MYWLLVGMPGCCWARADIQPARERSRAPLSPINWMEGWWLLESIGLSRLTSEGRRQAYNWSGFVAGVACVDSDVWMSAVSACCLAAVAVGGVVSVGVVVCV